MVPEFVITPSAFSPNLPVVALINPHAGADHGIAAWFHNHLTHGFVAVLRAFSEFGDAESIGIALGCIVLFFAWKRWWPSLVTLVVAVPGGMLLNEWLKVLVHRHRPFVDGWFVDWSGYSFASGHTIGATLLYGQLALFIVPAIKGHRRRALIIATALLFVLMVGFSRVALGAHYLTDVLAGICLGSIWLMVCLFVGRQFRPANGLIETALVEQPLLVPVEQRVLVPVETVRSPSIDSQV
jgi:membrane-associated phospholipid phosphatase